MLSRTAHAAALVVVSGSLVLGYATAALAHATYESSEPPDEGTVASPPSQVSAEFSEPLIPENSFMDVTDPCGADVGGATTVTAKSMTVQQSGTHAGEYVVSWKAHSSVDGHVTEGTFSFTSTGGDECPGEGGGGAGGTRSRSGGGSGGSSGGGGASGDGGSGGGASTGGASSGNGGAGSDTSGERRTGGNERDRRSTGKHRGGKHSSDPVPAVAQRAESDVPDVPSALEGLPLDGLAITLAVAALIGAAAGKIYVSLHGDES